MIWAYILIFGSTAILGASAVLALYWAATNGQFRDMKAGAEVIFDRDEPVGAPTDLVFTDKKKLGRRGGRKAGS